MTRPTSTLSEAMSYYRLARAGNIYGQFMSEEQRAEGVEFERVTTEVSGCGAARRAVADLRTGESRTLRLIRLRMSSFRLRGSKSEHPFRRFGLAARLHPLGARRFAGRFPTHSTPTALLLLSSCDRSLTFSHPLEPVTIVGYGMKRRRYEDVHRMALRWPSRAFTYIGIDNDHEQEADYLGEVRCRPLWLDGDH